MKKRKCESHSNENVICFCLICLSSLCQTCVEKHDHKNSMIQKGGTKIKLELIFECFEFCNSLLANDPHKDKSIGNLSIDLNLISNRITEIEEIFILRCKLCELLRQFFHKITDCLVSANQNEKELFGQIEFTLLEEFQLMSRKMKEVYLHSIPELDEGFKNYFLLEIEQAVNLIERLEISLEGQADKKDVSKIVGSLKDTEIGKTSTEDKVSRSFVATKNLYNPSMPTMHMEDIHRVKKKREINLERHLSTCFEGQQMQYTVKQMELIPWGKDQLAVTLLTFLYQSKICFISVKSNQKVLREFQVFRRQISKFFVYKNRNNIFIFVQSNMSILVYELRKQKVLREIKNENTTSSHRNSFEDFCLFNKNKGKLSTYLITSSYDRHTRIFNWMTGSIVTVIREQYINRMFLSLPITELERKALGLVEEKGNDDPLVISYQVSKPVEVRVWVFRTGETLRSIKDTLRFNYMYSLSILATSLSQNNCMGEKASCSGSGLTSTYSYQSVVPRNIIACAGINSSNIREICLIDWMEESCIRKFSDTGHITSMRQVNMICSGDKEDQSKLKSILVCLSKTEVLFVDQESSEGKLKSIAVGNFSPTTISFSEEKNRRSSYFASGGESKILIFGE